MTERTDRGQQMVPGAVIPAWRSSVPPTPPPPPSGARPCDPARVTRFEVIDHSGRVLVRYDVAVDLLYQDDGRTLKVVLTDRSGHVCTEERS